ncbi:signal peptidase I [Staphylococcus pseudoxylosus]|uniref:Signal peptidase I n=1 Tax=Staphylococcus pseudoxylosus TaxID=2282419 RepID=A0AAQ0S6G0_9STAP|nr:signal peptidase I [Staphylococcus pseudoxylosus]MEB5782714.1 signal peptidase I [Staphylococcus pseudoxylosus]MEB6332461.1 signal peptidase I [Staphylococcus pseudoxylosus]RMI84390.1 signal peptidase I [Staphylococcus pseudoxylosus]RQM85198.1 signal peptidase I [Staphylococcus xylosus]
MKKHIIEWVLSILIGIAVALLINTFIFTRYTVSGSSMFPTFHDHDELIVSKLSVPLNKIHRGDVIVFHATKDKDYIKRLIGVPGDKVEYKENNLYINDKYINEPYLDTNKNNKSTKYLTKNFNVSDLKHAKSHQTIPKGKYLVLGDNRYISNDSRRALGLVPNDKVIGKVSFRFLPLKDIQINFYPTSFNSIND